MLRHHPGWLGSVEKGETLCHHPPQSGLGGVGTEGLTLQEGASAVGRGLASRSEIQMAPLKSQRGLSQEGPQPWKLVCGGGGGGGGTALCH